MNVMVPLPDDFAARFGSEAQFRRHVVEVLALDEFRAGRMSADGVRDILGFATPDELEAFLIANGASHGGCDERRDAAADLVEAFQAFRAGKTLGGLDVKEMISEGRR